MSKKLFSYILIIVTYAIILIAVILNLDKVGDIFLTVFSILSPVVIGFCIAFILDKPSSFFYNLFCRICIKEKSKHKKELRILSKTLALLFVYLLFLAFISLIFVTIIPQLGNSITAFIGNINEYSKNIVEILNDIEEWFSSFHFDFGQDTGDATQGFTYEGGALIESIKTYLTDLISKIPTYIDSYLPKIYNLTKSVASSVTNIILGFAFSIYMLAGKEHILRQIKNFCTAYLPKNFIRKSSHVLNITVDIFRNFVNGRIYDALIVGVLCFLGMTIFGFQYSLLISFFVAVTNVIPIVGPFLGAIPSVFLLLLVDPMQAIWFTVFIIVLQQLDGNIIGPKIVGGSVGLPAWWVMVSVLVGGGLLGVFGMLIGVPIFAVVYKIISEKVNKRLADREKAETVSAVVACESVPETQMKSSAEQDRITDIKR